jgi:hypothetical protein
MTEKKKLFVCNICRLTPQNCLGHQYIHPSLWNLADSPQIWRVGYTEYQRYFAKKKKQCGQGGNEE